MGNIYSVSDVHSCFTKFKQSTPKDASKIIHLGDLFNKCTEQEKTLLWWLQNHNNPRYVFLWGNHEIRFYEELKAYILKQYSGQFDIVSLTKDVWFNAKESNINITNVAIDLIEKKVISIKNILEAFKTLHWYHVEEINGTTYKFSHASWQIDKPDEQQDKRNLVYDTVHLLVDVTKKEPTPKMQEYISRCQENKIKHIIGHFPCPKVFRQQAPYVYQGVFYYIDNGNFQRANNMYWLKL